jgi:hypothetical protein
MFWLGTGLISDAQTASAVNDKKLTELNDG